jgi:hypothetical protein
MLGVFWGLEEGVAFGERRRLTIRCEILTFINPVRLIKCLLPTLQVFCVMVFDLCKPARQSSAAVVSDPCCVFIHPGTEVSERGVG